MPKIFILALFIAARAWSIAPNAITDFNFGTLPCKIYPNTKIECFQNGAQLFSVNVAANDLIRSPDGKFLLGLSRNPSHAYSFWVLDQTGKILLKQSRPSTLCVARQPKPKFVLSDKGLEDVKVQGCKGKELSLQSLTEK